MLTECNLDESTTKLYFCQWFLLKATTPVNFAQNYWFIS